MDEPKNPGTPVPAKSGLAAKLASAQESIAAVTGAQTAEKKAETQKAFQQMISQKARPTKPLLKAGEVLFTAARPSLGCQFNAMKTIRFVDGYYATSDKEEIAYLRKFAEHFHVVEEKA